MTATTFDQTAAQPLSVTILLGLVCWLVTKIVVESELTRPLRDELEQRVQDSQVRHTGTWANYYIDGRWTWVWRKAQYLVTCHLCVGVWVGLWLALLMDGPYPDPTHPMAVVLTALTYKAIGHLVLTIEGALTR